MGWKSYVGGVATAVGVAGAIYFVTQVNNFRGEKTVFSKKVDDATVRLIKQDRKWMKDDYRIEILDNEGKVKVQLQGYGNKFERAEIRGKEGLEASIDF